MASATAIMRELSSASLPAFAIRKWRSPTPSLGPTAIVLAEVVVVVVLCFYKLDVNDRWSYEDIGYRTGFITICQLPLLFLLAAKRNIIAALVGTSYERINWLHRWASRVLLLSATIHMGYWFADWAPYDYIGTKIRTDSITKHGVISWAILVWIVISSMTPIRGWNYEFFVIQHIISFAVFIGFVYLHVPAEVHHWIWICVGLFFADRLLRGFWYVYNNMSLLHPKQRREGNMGGLWSCNAEFAPLPQNTTRITIRNPPISWQPGQHVFLSCHSLAPLQAHPFTISTLPSDGKMEFIVQSQKGGTRRIRRHAERVELNLPSINGDLCTTGKKSVSVEGPYGRIRPLRQFDSVVLLAGSTGVTFTMPLLRDLVHSNKRSSGQGRPRGSMWLQQGIVTRHAKFVWVVKSGSQLNWFSRELSQVIEDVKALREEGQQINVDISVYITCDETFTTEQKSILDALQPLQSSARSFHGEVEEVYTSCASDGKDGKVLGKDNKFEVRELDSSTTSSESATPVAKKSCGPNGTCCCTASIDEEDADAINPAVCSCNCGSSSTPSSASSSSSSTLDEKKTKQRQPLLHPAIGLFSGRPMPRTIIRKSLEQALGESAVVVCGPKGLVDDVRTSVVALSDERAVHKGTGAQGIWLHTEAFGY